MGKADPDATKSGRRRQLNVIYFIDSARTRSFSLSLGRLNVLLFLFFGMVTWSLASVGLIIWLADGQAGLATQLRTALATVFEYETRYESAYELAYPSGDKSTRPTIASAVSDESAKERAPVTEADEVAAPAAVAKPTEGDVAAAPAPADKAETQADEAEPTPAAPTDKPVQTASAAASAEELAVSVGNPVLEAGGESLELRFDLTSKASQDRAEGYVWAVAEFTADDGKKTYIGAPASIQVKVDGEPTFPQRSAIFGIKRFKKKIFSFPLVKEKAGTFTGVRIGVMDRNGANKTTYNVPVQIRVGKGGTSSNGPEAGVVDGKSG